MHEAGARSLLLVTAHEACGDADGAATVHEEDGEVATGNTLGGQGLGGQQRLAVLTHGHCACFVNRLVQHAEERQRLAPGPGKDRAQELVDGRVGLGRPRQ